MLCIDVMAEQSTCFPTKTLGVYCAALAHATVAMPANHELRRCNTCDSLYVLYRLGICVNIIRQKDIMVGKFENGNISIRFRCHFQLPKHFFAEETRLTITQSFSS